MENRGTFIIAYNIILPEFQINYFYLLKKINLSYRFVNTKKLTTKIFRLPLIMIQH